jgi:hypothetical protein
VRARLSLLLLLAALAACDDPAGPSDRSARSTSDRADDATGAQVHVVYAIPSDGVDLGHDTTGALARSVGSFQGWLASKAGGRRLRLDTRDGELDVTFVRLARTDAAMAAYDPFVRDSLERELGRRGLIRAGKVYAVYYDGGSTYACGGAAWPPTVPGRVAAMFLKGTPPGVSCARPFVASASAFPGYWEFAMLHDLLHTLGVVDKKAPHHTAAIPAHVPEPNDLMYSGSAPWVIDQTTELDVGGDDYFGTAVPDSVTRLQESPYLTGVSATPPIAPSTTGEGVTIDLGKLPLHPPLPAPASR